MPVALQTGENRHDEVAERKLGFCLGDNTLHSLSKRNYPRSNLIYIKNFIFPRRKQCFPSPGSMQLDMAGRWTKMHVCSKSGPNTQVRKPKYACHLFRTTLLYRMRKCTKLACANAFYREIFRGPSLWPQDMESQLPLCNELTSWHWGGERQKH